jgi:hypothetical protein
MSTATRVLTEVSLFPHSICVSSRSQYAGSRRLNRANVSRIYDEYALEHMEESEELDEVLDMIKEDEENL